VPVRLVTVTLHRRLALKEPVREALKVAVPMLPTLVFTLVIAGILRDRYDIPGWLFGGLIVYAFVTTVLPALVTRAPPPDFLLPALLPTAAERLRKTPAAEPPAQPPAGTPPGSSSPEP